MKYTKRFLSSFLSMAMVLVLILGLSVSVSAATTITINDGDIEGAKYSAFKLLHSTNAADDDGTGSDKFAYTVNTKYRDALMSALNLTDSTDHTVTDIEIVEKIRGLNDDGIRTFADAVYALVKSMTPEATTANNEFSVDQGYYLIVETAIGSAGTNAPTDTFSLIMLDTAGLDDITVKTKENTPTVTKLVEEVNDSEGTSGWSDSADHDIGDTVNFKITGTVSDRYAYYNEYGYKFVDTMEIGLSLVHDSVKVSVSGVDVTDQFTITESVDPNDSARLDGFTAYSNLKDLTGVTVSADTEVLVEYSAILNENALLGAAGNRNKVVLHYENNPYADEYVTPPDDPDTPPELPGKTPPSVVIIFTFKGTLNKVDKDGATLKGAGFTLYKWDAESNSWTSVGDEIKQTDTNVFSWEGLDVGKYKLVETTVPAGYNKAEDLLFEIEAVYDGSTPDALEQLIIRGEDGNSISTGDTPIFDISPEFVFTTNVVNLTGAELPGTGGMGTTLIYIVGGILFVSALVLLITKKRMSAEK